MQFPPPCPLLRDPHDTGTWTVCCSRYFRPHAVRATGDAGLAEDVLHESWDKILRGILTFRGGPTADRWVRRIVSNSNSAADARRQIQRRPEIGLDHTRAMVDSGASPETCAGDRALLRVLRETVTLLPE